MTMKNKPREEKDRSGVSAFGGYSTRHEYEKRREKGRVFRVVAQVALCVFLLVFSCFGLLAVLRGDFSPEKNEGGEGLGSIRVPTQSEISENQRTLSETISGLELSLITLEVPLEEGGYAYGTGFLVSEEGYAVCSASLLNKVAGGRITAYTGMGFSSIVEKIGVEDSIGVGLVRLSESFAYTPVATKNSAFATRGQTLYIVPSQKAKLFYGTVSSGLVASVGPTTALPGEFGASYVNMLYLDVTPNESQFGALVVDQSGSAVGFCTDSVAAPYPGLASVVPIHSVYTFVNNLLSEK